MAYLRLLLCACSVSLGLHAFTQPLAPKIWKQVQQHPAFAGIPIDAQESLVLTSSYSSDHNGVTHYYLAQNYEGIPVEGAQASVHVDAQDKVRAVHADIVIRPKDLSIAAPTLSAVEALEKAAEELGLFVTYPPFMLEAFGGPEQAYLFSAHSLAAEPIDVRLRWYRGTHSTSLTWAVTLHTLDRQHVWTVWIDATNGTILSQRDAVTHCTWPSEAHAHSHTEAKTGHRLHTPLDGSSYRVYPYPLESPNKGNSTVVSNPADSLASPFGWHDIDGVAGPEYLTTRGNNVWAKTDRNGNNNSGGFSPDGGLALTFDYPADTSLSWVEGPNPAAAVTNLFYWNNLIHDVWYHMGFTEAAGNFQANNYGRGGIGGDFVYADAQDGSGSNNANFFTPPDGETPRMQMFLWNTITRNLQVNAPMDIAGSYVAPGAGFGPGLPEDSMVTGDLALLLNSDGNSDACESISNPQDLAGKIAVCVRSGNCFFPTQIARAEAAGALAVIVINNQSGDPVIMPAGNNQEVNIPSVMIGQADGDLLRNAMTQGTVNVSLQQALPEAGYDSDFDNGVIVHEYAHGLSNRLTGGPLNTACLFNEEQAGEGWSDFFSLVMTHRIGDSGPQARGIGSYVLGEAPNGAGIRPFPYSTDTTINPVTYDYIKNLSVPHGVGSVMCSMLWDLYWEFINLYGFDPDLVAGEGGNRIATQLVMDGMALQTCSPGFTDVRDAILLADELAYNGAHHCMIWKVFARRGLGYSADQGSVNSRSDGIEAYDLPPFCRDTLFLAKTVDRSRVQDGDTLSYRFIVSNRTGRLLTDVHIHDSLPTGLELISAEGCTAVDTDSGLVLQLGNMPDQRVDTCFMYARVKGNDLPAAFIRQTDDLEGDISQYVNESQGGTIGWQHVTSRPRSGQFSFFVENLPAPRLHTLTLPSFTGGAQTLFAVWHAYQTEEGWDGGVVEFQVNGGEWQDIGPYWMLNGYNSSVQFNNPLGARPAFTGDSEGYLLSWADLGDFAEDTVQLRFRFGSDQAVNDVGWWLDDFSYFDAARIFNTACVKANEGFSYCDDQGQATFVVPEALLGTSIQTPAAPENQWTVFPNPATDLLWIKAPSVSKIPTRITLLNPLGQSLNEWHHSFAGDTHWTVELGSLPDGLYLLHITQGTETHTFQIRKQ